MDSKPSKQNWGGVRKGAGRPAGTTKEVKKTDSVYIRVTAEEKAQIERLAEKAGLSISKYILQKILGE